MQRILFICVYIAMAIDTSRACNVCACSSLSNAIGVLPQYQTHFVGIRTTYRRFDAEHPISILNPTKNTSQSIFTNAELIGRWYPSSKIQVLGFLPMNHYVQTTGASTTIKKGMGDMSIQVNYLFKTVKDSTQWKTFSMFGIGAKLATGQFQSDEPAGLQLGTGSNDFWMSSVQTLKYQKTLLMSEASYRLNGTNAFQYHFGNKLNVSERLYYSLKNRCNMYLPFIAYQFESAKLDQAYKVNQTYTGGYSHLLGLGIDVYKNFYQIGINLMHPIKQNLGSHHVVEHNRFQLNFIYFLKSNP
ncbi:MAG: hypothetical protein RLZZ60_909 [Bacteroidota bacterium]|jgi:hypothetical protein